MADKMNRLDLLLMFPLPAEKELPVIIKYSMLLAVLVYIGIHTMIIYSIWSIGPQIARHETAGRKIIPLGSISL